MRYLFASSVLAAMVISAPAVAGGNCVGACYQRVHQPPVYGTRCGNRSGPPATETVARHVAPFTVLSMRL